jgi:S-DNA-T family DNA segregation ATPase FtsK/SpoIIIE
MVKKQTDNQVNIKMLTIGHYLREVLFVLMVTLAIFLLVSLLTYHSNDSAWSYFSSASTHTLNAAGKAGAWMSDIVLSIFGYFSYLYPLMLIFSAWRWCKKIASDMSAVTHLALVVFKVIGWILLLISGPSLIALSFPTPIHSMPFYPGGILGHSIIALLIPIFNDMGVLLIVLTSFLMGVTLFTGFSWLRFAELLGETVLTGLTVFFTRWLSAFGRGLKNQFFRIVRQLKTKRIAWQENITLSAAPVPKKSQVPVSIDQENLAPINHTVKKSKGYASVVHSVPASNELPPLSLLNQVNTDQRMGYSTAQLQKKAAEVERKLLDFGIEVKVTAFYPGPVVTRFELELAAGTKVNKISSLSKDLARSLSVTRVRIVEVIPGKSVIGLELPNVKREIVTIREVLHSNAYQQTLSPLTLALGKDIAGHAVVVDLAKMPHLLVAGTTGAGKSVGLNNMLLSMLYKTTPKHLRLILIDPKMLELSIYEGIPHLLIKVIKNMIDAAKALRWAVFEMERRYQVMASLGVRNIKGYNHRIRQAKKQSKPLLDPLWKAQPNEHPPELDELPHIVIFADEFADMMVTVGKKVELLITRLAQKGRAAGIHLILATQRPSVDVITGLIKANISTRIAFQVSSKVDSRTILDRAGAEQLLGYGDMLYLPPGAGMPIRVHGAYVTDDEVHAVVDFLKKTGQPAYLDNIFDDALFQNSADPYVNPKGASGAARTDAEQDPLYDQAVDMVLRSRRVSTSSIQRQFKIGYNRAARIVEAMESAGVVTPMENNGTRTVLVQAPEE